MPAEQKKSGTEGSTGTKPISMKPPVKPMGSSSGYTERKAKSGEGMDRVVVKKKQPLKWLAYGVAALGAAYFIFTVVQDAQGGRSFKVPASRLVISSVSEGTFEDFIPVRGRVTPLKTLYLDAIEGGRIERILVEDGAALEKGDLIVELSNSNLQVSFTANETRVTEQLNNLRSQELQLEQNRLGHKRNLVDFNYQIKRLTRRAERERILVTSGAINKAQLEDTEDDLEYNINRRDLTLESQATDARLQESQLEFLREAGGRLEESIVVARRNLESLNVRAPVAGKLSGFNVEIGQNIPRGNRLGQIDDPDNYKLTANIDEFYLGRVDLGQAANFERTGTNYAMRISKIYPQVNNGQFVVDFIFDGAQPSGIRRGQTIQTRLTLGDATKAKLIPNGAFFQDTGGNWVFVVSEDGSQAVKRSVRLGRRNARFIEVLDGLEVGERVVTSPYTSFVEMDRLKLGSD
ncbi:MAG: HlyD family efflux transporter periplasmic adaptor subunit [Kordiimonadaceae bacterium]|nr:HlyD family efflux transporter periplasmic adaptor subunit [Kordiimonadaceae bacterium]